MKKLAITLSAIIVASLLSLGYASNLKLEASGNRAWSLKDFVHPVQADVTTPQAQAGSQEVTSVQQLAGKKVMTYRSLSSAQNTDGSSAEIVALGTDSILIRNFAAQGIDVKALVNLQTGVVTLPAQLAFTHPTYGQMWLAMCTNSGKPDYNNTIGGIINTDGSISFITWWGLFVKSGINAGKFMEAGYKTRIEPANATMQVEVSGADALTWNVGVSQPKSNLVVVKNFGNHGQQVEIVLNPDSTISIGKQLVWETGENSNTGNYYTHAADWNTEAITGNTIVGKAMSDVLTWGNWAMLSTSRYYTGKLTSGKITGVKFTLPTLTSATWEGEGSESSPYKISTPGDLLLLAAKVNAGQTFEGKNFRIENDLDLADCRFTPIGNEAKVAFGGTLDGNGKAITGLEISASDGYAGLLGNCTAASVVKNLTLKDVHVLSQANLAGAVAGYSAGKIVGCTATGHVESYGTCTGGIAGMATNLSGCSFKGIVNGRGGETGGIVGFASGAVTDCHASATVLAGSVRAALPASITISERAAGGLAGALYGANAKCLSGYFSGELQMLTSDDYRAGGIVGANYLGQVDRCYAVGSVNASSSAIMTGGLVGSLCGTLTNSYFTGNVQNEKSKNTGGITGYVQLAKDGTQSVVRNCYFAGQIAADLDGYNRLTGVRETLGRIQYGAEPTIEHIYYDKQLGDLGSAQHGVLTSELTSAKGLAGIDGEQWVLSEGYYPRLKGMEHSEAALLSASAVQLDKAFPDNASYMSATAKLNLLGKTVVKYYRDATLLDAGNYTTVSGSELKLNGEFPTETLALYDASVGMKLITLKTAPAAFEGTGKAESPFLIKTKADLMKLGKITTNARQYFPGVHFLQTADIDLEQDTAFTGICDALTDYDDMLWAGIYDGGGHTLHNMKLSFIDWQKAPTATTLGTPLSSSGSRSSFQKGLFGQIAADGVVRNLTIASDCQLQFWGYAGAIAGCNYGTIENCKNFAAVTAYNNTAGGIVGSLKQGGLVRNCLNAGSVKVGITYAGGIAGQNEGTIDASMNTGSVKTGVLSTLATNDKTSTAGGIVGAMRGGVMRNVANAGLVQAYKEAGGLSGVLNGTLTHDGNNDIYSSMNYGTVFCSELASTGAIAGDGYHSDAKIENVKFDAQATGLLAAANDRISGAEAMTTASLTSGTAPKGFADSVWTFVKGRYPVLRRFDTEPQVVAASQIVLTAAQGENVRQMRHNATLSAADGTSWVLVEGSKFTVSGNTLSVPSTTTMVVDTITATLHGFMRPYALRAVYALPLNGTGSPDSPYQISSVADWDTVATYMNSAQNSFDGQYFKLMNDIDFSNAEFIPWAADGTTAFNGVFLGSGHTVKGITYRATTANQGAFCYVGATGEVRDLTVQGAITSTLANVGGMAGRVKGTLRNCVSEMTVSSTGTGTGGVAALALAGARFEDCENHGAVTSTHGTVAGIAARAEGGTIFKNSKNSGTITYYGGAVATRNVGGIVAYSNPATYEGCVNTGEIVGKSAAHVGGIVGLCTEMDTLRLINCHNEGKVDGASGVGGVLGFTTNAVNDKPTIVAIGCYNTGDISSTISTTWGTAGVLGNLTPHSYVADCYNTGSVSAKSAQFTSGVWGSCYDGMSTDQHSTIKRCYNTGTVTGAKYVGGVGGRLLGFSTVDSCYNTAQVSGQLGVAGIGNVVLGREVLLNHCWNTGNVTATSNGCGGIDGVGNRTAYAVNCWNTGKIGSATTTNVGGLGGQSGTIYVNCYNRGEVTGSRSVGGLVGLPFSAARNKSATSFYNCYNAGRVAVAPSDTTSGNIVGSGHVGDTHAQASWNSTNVVENTYYVTDFGKFATDSLATSTTVRDLAALTAWAAPSIDIAGVKPAGWDWLDGYSMPVVAGFADNDAAKAYAAAVVLTKDGDTYAGVSGNMKLGMPEAVTWTTNNDAVTISGNDATHKVAADGVVLTATCGDYNAEWTLALLDYTGVTEVNSNKTVVTTDYYNLAGMKSAKPFDGVNIVVKTFTDGTKATTKYVAH